jgi:CHRD domain
MFERFSLRNSALSLSVVVVSAITSISSSSAFADTVALQANLQPSSEVPPRVSKGHGMLKATFDTTTKTLQWTVTYADLSGPATMAHFHGPAPVGQNAKVQVAIDKNALPSPITGQATLSEEQANELMAGQYYFNIHTEKNPTGEVRGQVMPAN